MVEQKQTIGVLALQGAFYEHTVLLKKALDELNLKAEYVISEVRTPSELFECCGLIVPGGESTAISLIAERNGMLEPLRKFAQDPTKAVWGTCAGLIFCASKIKNAAVGQQSLGCLDVEVARNVFGAQLNSFTMPMDFSSFIKDCDSFPAVFIRAPVVTEIGKGVEVLCRLEFEDRPELVVAVKQGKKLGTSFHPELTSDCAVHRFFITDFVRK